MCCLINVFFIDAIFNSKIMKLSSLALLKSGYEKIGCFEVSEKHSRL